MKNYIINKSVCNFIYSIDIYSIPLKSKVKIKCLLKVMHLAYLKIMMYSIFYK